MPTGEHIEHVELSFGTSGLRGLVADMTDRECYINVCGFLDFLHEQGYEYKAVYIAGDLRSSSPRIMRAVARASQDRGLETVNCGFIPTPALALFSEHNRSPGIMVTGSHIPDDRNGIKFYKPDGEILKSDESEVKESVQKIRMSFNEGIFDDHGNFLAVHDMPDVEQEASRMYISRYTDIFQSVLKDKLVVLYQHSAVGRDMIADILEQCGATVERVGRSDKFIPIDTENVTPKDHAYFKTLANEHPDAFAILSTDGDSDRPFLVDENGIFHRGDDLGAVVAQGLSADTVVYPISSSDALDRLFEANDIPYIHTKIGSPYVIRAMRDSMDSGMSMVVGWEANGGFLTAGGITINSKPLSSLQTRDAVFPMLYCLMLAANAGTKVSNVFDKLPPRFTQAGMLDDVPTSVYGSLKAAISIDNEANRLAMQNIFGNKIDGLGSIDSMNLLDGIRMYFSGGDVIHVRGSGNAPQLRVYCVADSQDRADEIVDACVKGGGVLQMIQSEFSA